MIVDINDVLMVDEATIKLLVPEISPSVDPTLLKRFIQLEQNKHIRPLLGYDLFNQLLTEIKANNLTVANKYLLDNYLVMILALFVFKRLIYTSSYQVENTGLRKKYSESSEIAEFREMDFYRTNIQDDIDFYINSMIKFIDANPTEYTLYFNNTDPRCNTETPERRRYNFQIGKI